MIGLLANCILHAAPDLYIAQRGGKDAQSGLVYVLNNLGDQWSGTSLKTKWANRSSSPLRGMARMMLIQMHGRPMRTATPNFQHLHAATACMLR
jgi:hypothetical protein